MSEPTHLQPEQNLVCEMPDLFRAILRDHLDPPPMSPEATAAWARATEIVRGLDEKARRRRIRLEEDHRESAWRAAARVDFQSRVVDHGKGVTVECSDRVWASYKRSNCSRPGRQEFQGRRYCGQHLKAKIDKAVRDAYNALVKEDPEFFSNDESRALQEVLDQERLELVKRWASGGGH